MKRRSFQSRGYRLESRGPFVAFFEQQSPRFVPVRLSMSGTSLGRYSSSLARRVGRLQQLLPLATYIRFHVSVLQGVVLS